MPGLRDIVRALLQRARWILVRGALAALVAAALTAALPLEWESTALLLPPERRTDAFEFQAKRSGMRRLLDSFRLQDRTHPVEVFRAILKSDESARRLVTRFDLREHWRVATNDEAERRLARALTIETIPFGGIEVRARTRRADLSADLANASAEILGDRLSELYQSDVEREREFLSTALRESLGETERIERSLARFRVDEGIAVSEEQRERIDELLLDLSVQLALARTEHARALENFGKDSPEARDAARRVEELSRTTRSLPRIGAVRASEESREQEIQSSERVTHLLNALRGQLVQGGAARSAGVRVLDPAIPAEHPDWTPFLVAIAVAFLFAPAAVVARTHHAGLRRALRSQVEDPGTGDLAERLEHVLDLLLDPPIPERFRLAALVTGAALLAVSVARQPLVLAGLLGVVFLLILASRRVSAWLILVLALPWAWDYQNWDFGFEIQFPTEPGIILFTLLWGYSLALRGNTRIPLSSLLVTSVLTVAWTAVAATTSMDPVHSAMQTVAVCGFVIVGAIFPILEIRRLSTIEQVLRIYLVSGCLLSVYGLVQLLRSPLPLDRAAFFMGEGFLYNHGPFSAYLGFALGPAIVYLLVTPHGKGRFGLLSATALMTIATVVSLTRAAWVAVAVLLLAVAFARSRHFLRTITIPLVVSALVLGGILAFSPTITQSFQRYLERSVSVDYGSNLERLNRWGAAVRMLFARPFTGVGPTAYETAYPDYRDASFASQLSDRRMGAHSDLLRIAAEQGVPGVIVLSVLVVAFYRTGLRLMKRGSDPRVRRLAAALCAGMLTYTVHGLFNEYWRLPKIAFTLWAFVGLLGALEQIETRRRREAARTHLSSQVTM